MPPNEVRILTMPPNDFRISKMPPNRILILQNATCWTSNALYHPMAFEYFEMPPNGTRMSPDPTPTHPPPYPPTHLEYPPTHHPPTHLQVLGARVAFDEHQFRERAQFEEQAPIT